MAIEHNAILDWPNGEGYTPVSQEYLDLINKRDAIYEAGRDYEMCLDDLPPDQYNQYCQLDNDIGVLQLNGHVGKSVRF